MLYLSVMLVFVGLAIILIAVFSGLKKSAVTDSDNGKDSDSFNKDEGDFELRIDSGETETSFMEDAIPAPPADDSIAESGDELPLGVPSETGPEKLSILDELHEHYEKDADEEHEKSVIAGSPERPMVVLFEDSSGLINYEDGSAQIDKTFKEYSKLKRIGKGNLDVSRSGINFYSGKNFFRYDFHNVDNLKIGRNFFSLILKGSDVVRLFMFENGGSALQDVRKGFESYRKGSV